MVDLETFSIITKAYLKRNSEKCRKTREFLKHMEDLERTAQDNVESMRVI